MMSMMQLGSDFISTFNTYYRRKTPFLFVISFDGKNAEVIPLDSIDPEEILYSVQTSQGIVSNANPAVVDSYPVYTADHVCFQRYSRACRSIMKQQEAGESYLANLTFPSAFHTRMNLKEIYHASFAPYKLYYRDMFTLFSPEQFVRIEGDMISTSPMKGTLDASLTDAKQRLLADEKEAAEHLTIVDLLRNDLGSVCCDVYVDKYRYVEKIKTGRKDLLQTSSLIKGRLSSFYTDHPGEIFSMLLPAGSVTGAPKRKTVEIITEAEGYERGYYTGVFGCFDGSAIESAVMIRFVESIDGKLYYKSGGGITVYSVVEDEYNEMRDKVYVPLR